MICLTMQSTLLGLNKAGKIYKTQSTANNPVSEEEEHHKEKESDNVVILYLYTPLSTPQLISLKSVNWPRSSTRCFSRVDDITVPPPEFS